MTVSAALLVKDPPLDRLAALVDYLRPACSDVAIVVDDRTRPETVATLATWRDVTLVPFRWVDDFAAARNAALPHCRGDWTLVVDPDELPSAAMLDYVHAIDTRTPVEVGRPGAAAFLFWTVTYVDGRATEPVDADWHIRLFRTDRGRFYRPVHELVALDGLPEHETRGTPLCPKAPRNAYLIHSTTSRAQAVAAPLYDAIGARA